MTVRRDHVAPFPALGYHVIFRGKRTAARGKIGIPQSALQEHCRRDQITSLSVSWF